MQQWFRLGDLRSGLRQFLDTGNFVRFLVALALAFMLWAWVTYDSDPEITRMISSLPVMLEGVPDELELVGEPPTVNTELRGAQSRLQPLERESVEATVDAIDIDSPGTYELEVEIDTPDGIRVQSVSPETIIVEIDRITSRSSVPVEINEPADVPPNYQVESISSDPRSVTISGPASSVQQVAHARIDIQIDGRTGSFHDTWVPVLVTSDGNEINGVEISPNEVDVRVDLDVRGQIRRVIPMIVGDDLLAPGYELVRATVLPSDEVIVDADESDLANVFFLTTESIDVSGWDESDIVRDVPLDLSQLPAAAEVETDSVHVSIEIRRQVHQREITDVPIIIMNALAGTDVEIEPVTGSVTLEASRSVLDEVDSSEITLFIDVRQAGEGQHQFSPRVILPAQVQYSEIKPALVTVTVEEADEPDLVNQESDI